MEADDGDRQAVEDEAPVDGEVEPSQDQTAQRVDRSGQLAAVEAGALGLAGEEVAVLGLFAEEDGLPVPAAALGDQGHLDQF